MPIGGAISVRRMGANRSGVRTPHLLVLLISFCCAAGLLAAGSDSASAQSASFSTDVESQSGNTTGKVVVTANKSTGEAEFTTSNIKHKTGEYWYIVTSASVIGDGVSMAGGLPRSGRSFTPIASLSEQFDPDDGDGLFDSSKTFEVKTSGWICRADLVDDEDPTRCTAGISTWSAEGEISGKTPLEAPSITKLEVSPDHVRTVENPTAEEQQSLIRQAGSLPPARADLRVEVSEPSDVDVFLRRVEVGIRHDGKCQVDGLKRIRKSIYRGELDKLVDKAVKKFIKKDKRAQKLSKKKQRKLAQKLAKRLLKNPSAKLRKKAKKELRKQLKKKRCANRIKLGGGSSFFVGSEGRTVQVLGPGSTAGPHEIVAQARGTTSGLSSTQKVENIYYYSP